MEVNLKQQDQQIDNQVDVMDVDMEEKNDQSLVGFYHNKDYDLVEYFSVSRSSSQQAPPPDYSSYFLNNKANFCASTSQGWSVLAVLNSSNGLLLLYTSCFLRQGRDSAFLVKNPISGDSVFGYPPPPTVYDNCVAKLKQKRFLVYGFAFEPNARPDPNYTIVQVTDVVAPDGESRTLMVWKVNSLSLNWGRKFHHEVDSLLNGVHHNYTLFGPSVYLNGNLHWLLQPSGVIMYDIENECFDLSFVNVPGDLVHVDEFGLCYCTKKNTENNAAAGTRSCVCNCRFLGECGGWLAYARVTGDSQFSIWILEDYQSRLWSQNYHIVENLPGSLFDGRVLAFEKKAGFVLLRLKRDVFWYNCNTKQLKKVHEICKKYDHEDKCDGFLVPYNLPRDNPPITPQMVPVNPSGKQKTAWPSIPSSAPMDRLFYHYAVTHLAAKFKLTRTYDKIVEAGLSSKIPFRSPLYVTVRRSNDTYIWATTFYSDLIRLEASFHNGCFFSSDPQQQSFQDNAD